MPFRSDSLTSSKLTHEQAPAVGRYSTRGPTRWGALLAWDPATNSARSSSVVVVTSRACSRSKETDVTVCSWRQRGRQRSPDDAFHTRATRIRAGGRDRVAIGAEARMQHRAVLRTTTSGSLDRGLRWSPRRSCRSSSDSWAGLDSTWSTPIQLLSIDGAGRRHMPEPRRLVGEGDHVPAVM